MPIRWNAAEVSEAMDQVEEQLKLATPYLEQARTAATEARRIANLPQYIDQRLVRIISEIDRTIGGSQWEPTGRLRAGIEAVRESIPATELERQKHRGKQTTIFGD